MYIIVVTVIFCVDKGRESVTHIIMWKNSSPSYMFAVAVFSCIADTSSVTCAVSIFVGNCPTYRRDTMFLSSERACFLHVRSFKVYF